MHITPRTKAEVKPIVVKPEFLNKNIWSIAGGKGGTGKTVLSANLGIGMAIFGYKVILIDADLGVPNLHNYLRVKRPQTTLDDFLTKKVRFLSDVIIDTPHKNLKFISGGTNLVGIANLHYAKKQQIIRHINKLEADLIIVDLGAGISNNTVDFFNISTCGLVISNPEPSANQDAYFFLKNAIYRRIKLFTKVNEEFKKAFNIYIDTNGNGVFEIPKFFNFLQEYSNNVYRDFDQFLSEFQPRLIMNKLRKSKQKHDGIWFVNLVRTFLQIDVNFIGEMRYDKRIIKSSENVFPFIIRYPGSSISKNLFSILTDLNTTDMKYHSVRTFRQFKSLLKKQQKNWN